MRDKNNGDETNNSADPVIELVESTKKLVENLVPWPSYIEFFDLCTKERDTYKIFPD